MQAFQYAPKALLDSVEFVSRVVRAKTHSLDEELAQALPTRGLGDAFVFGRVAEPYERALRRLPDDIRVFGCADGAARLGRGRPCIDSSALDDHSLRELRGRYRMQRVSVVIVADDFPWQLGRIVRTLRTVLANDVALLVAGRQAALVETLSLDELRAGQQDFVVERLSEQAAGWARFALRRRQPV